MVCSATDPGNDKLGTYGNKISGQRVQSLDLPVPSGYTVCSVAMVLPDPSQEIFYDDNIHFLLDGYWIMSSRKILTTILDSTTVPKPNGDRTVYTWDFIKVREDVKDLAKNDPSYCISPTPSNCILPTPEHEWAFGVNLSFADLYPVIKLSGYDKPVHQVKIFVTGDGDEEDCRHNSIDLLFNLGLVEISN